MRVKIEKTGINGEGIGYINRKPVFVPGALNQEEVDIDVVDNQKTYAIAKLNKVIKQSSDRVRPKCYIQSRCGACPLMIAKYPTQLQAKYDILRQSLIKYAQVNPRLIKDVVNNPVSYGYRNQCKLPFHYDQGTLMTGMYRPGSNYFIEVERCIIHEDGLEKVRVQILKVLNNYRQKAYDYHQKKGLRSLVIRGFEGQYQVTIVSGEHPFPQPMIDDLMKIKGIMSLWQSINVLKKTPEIFGPKMILVAGERYLPMDLDGLKLNLSPRSFFQLNTTQAVNLYRTVNAMVSDKKGLIVEAYCGVGAMSLYMKDKAERIIGIESIKDAVVNANMNARENGASNVEFVCADAAEKLDYISRNNKIDVLIVDPPRSGLDENMLSVILKSKMKEIIYVSCNPATLGKNLAVLKSRYDVETVIPFDMFSQTPQIESVTKLVRR
ncbi:MAG: 23S rRNA (uracil(1939)-C(5))-methyltransferase RlmD [Erysipelotrichaceae bacterium]